MTEVKKNILSIIFIIISFIIYFYGFYINENSAGGGGYNGDLQHILNNIQIFINKNSFNAILDQNYYSNRGPIIYLFYKKLYSFIDFTIYNQRLIVFGISSFIAIFFFLSLKIKYKKVDIFLIGLLASIILFSPYLRTSAYWGLEENYAILSALISSIFFNLVKNSKKKKILNLTLLIFFSSLCVYLDYKYIIIPLISFISMISTEKSVKIILFITFLYFVLAIPLFLLFYFWGGIFPKKVFETHGLEIFLNHIPYLLTIFGLYLFPFLWIKKKNFFQLCKNFFLSKNLFFYLIIVSISLFYIIFFFEVKNQDFHQNIGKGFFDKINNFLFSSNILLKNILLFISSIISFIIVCLTIENKKDNWLIFFYFIILSIFIYPLLQEYFDPIIFIILLTFATIDLKIKLKNILFLYFYYLFLFVCAFLYYKFKLNL